VNLIPDGPGPETAMDWVAITTRSIMADLYTSIKDWNEVSKVLRGMHELNSSVTDQDWSAIQLRRARTRDWVADQFSEFDLIITPTCPIDPPPAAGPLPKDYKGRKLPGEIVDMPFTVPFNLTGHPAASIPIGMSEAGMPIGIQIVGPRHRDDLVLRVAHMIEKMRPWHRLAPNYRGNRSQNETPGVAHATFTHNNRDVTARQ
jgi:aspartyl-tRNA(Asn)/glutamyl-tRNA(Gln) amidotransferase subunit A